MGSKFVLFVAILTVVISLFIKIEMVQAGPTGPTKPRPNPCPPKCDGLQTGPGQTNRTTELRSSSSKHLGVDSPVSDSLKNARQGISPSTSTTHRSLRRGRH